MGWLQKEIVLTPKPRGFHLVTGEIQKQLTELDRFEVGLAHIFIKHTSASLAINENADPSVRRDLEAHRSAHQESRRGQDRDLLATNHGLSETRPTPTSGRSWPSWLRRST